MSSWKKVLYEKQNYPDNYVSPTFLSELRKNINLYNFSVDEAIMGVCPVTHELTSTVLFFLIFLSLENNIFPLHFVTTGSSILIMICGTIHVLTSPRQESKSFLKWLPTGLRNAASCTFFLIVGYIFSPIFQVLTETISSDTIYAMVAMALLTHIVFQNYGAQGAIVSPSLSLNSAIFAAVCLASRLQTVTHTFALIMSAVQMFVLLPVLRQRMLENKMALVLMTLIFVCITLSLVYLVSEICCILLFCLCVFINFVCPVAFVYCQKYKETIFGPWDEAVVAK